MTKLIALAFTAVVALALASATFAKEPSKAGVPAVTGSAAAAQYGHEPEAAGQVTPDEPNQGGQITSDAPKQDVFTPPVVLSAEQDEGSLPLTGASLFVPTALGGAMLAVGLFLLYRTRRREH